MRIRRIVRRGGALITVGSLAVASLVAAPPSSATDLSPTSVGSTPSTPVPAGFGHAHLYGWGVVTLEDGTVAVGDYWNLRVQHYDTDGTLLDANFINNAGFGANQHQSPYGLGLDPRNGDIYIADTDPNTVDRYDYDPATGKATFEATWGSQGTSGFLKYQYPSRVAVDSVGRVYVVDTWANNIEIDTEDGVGLEEFGSFGVGGNKWKQPHGAAFEYNGAGVADDRLFVVDTNNKEIDVYVDDASDADDRIDNYSHSFGCAKSTGDPACKFVGDLRGIAIDEANGWVYIVDAAGERVHKYTTGGSWLLSWGKAAPDPDNPGPGEFVDGGRELAVDGLGQVWVGDMADFRAQVFDPDGDFLFEVPDPRDPPEDGGFNGPRGVAVDPSGNFFVTDTYNQRIQKFSPSGVFLLKWGHRGRDDYGFNYPRMLAVDPNDGSVVMTDTDNHRIKKYSNSGVFVWEVGQLGTTLGRFKNPHGVDVGPDGRIYVADSRNKRVQVLASNGTPLYAFGSEGTADGQFKYPRGIAVDTNGTATTADDTLWVADSVRDVVQHFELDGTFLGKFGSQGTADNQLSGPFDIETDDGHVYVADAQHHEIKVWTNPGPVAGNPAFIQVFGGRGKTLGKMVKPQGLDLSPDGLYLYVAEQGTDRIQKWSLFG